MFECCSCLPSCAGNMQDMVNQWDMECSEAPCYIKLQKDSSKKYMETDILNEMGEVIETM